MCTRLLAQMHDVPSHSQFCYLFSSHLTYTFHLFWECNFKRNSEQGKNGLLRVELSMWRALDVCFQFEACSVIQRKGSEPRHKFVVLSVCHLLFQPCSFSAKLKTEIQAVAVHVEHSHALSFLNQYEHEMFYMQHTEEMLHVQERCIIIMALLFCTLTLK